MVDLIKRTVTDCILDKKRRVVEVQTNSNLSGKELSEALQQKTPDIIKNIRYTFGTRDFEVETFSASEADNLYNAINGLLTGKIDSSNAVVESILGGVSVIGNIFTGWQSNKKAKIEGENAARQSELALQMKTLEMQQEQQTAANTRKTILIGAAAVVALLVVLIVIKK